MDSQLRIASKYSKFLCKSLNIDSSGSCIKGYTSITTNKECTGDSDCVAKENPKVYSKCRCAFSNTGKSYCDLHYGDDEWVAANKAVGEYNLNSSSNTTTLLLVVTLLKGGENATKSNYCMTGR